MAKAKLSNSEIHDTDIIIDSGSDITLISSECLKNLVSKPKVKTGQKINLVQVTGSATINGYVDIPIYFTTSEGNVLLEVEAYVVKGMSTPFILGNDFADQYQLSIMRKEGHTKLILGESNREINADNSTSGGMYDLNGSTFKISVKKPSTGENFKQLLVRYKRKISEKRRRRARDPFLRAAKDVVIPPQYSKNIAILSHNFSQDQTVYAERIFNFNNTPVNTYATPNILVNADSPFLPISNFSDIPLTIRKGQPLAYMKTAEKWLDQPCTPKAPSFEHQSAVANAIKSMSTIMTKPIAETIPHVEGDEPIEGGPKTAEVIPDPVSREALLSEVDISAGLSSEQRDKVVKIIFNNETAFGLNNRLGNYPAEVSVRMKPDAKPVSLPPFGVSPTNREIVDKQVDKWISWDAIEPSESPWGAPAFVVYRQGKPRVVIDFRKLNDLVVPDEFPLPRQDDILQALSGSQYLSTFDALAGFYQLELAKESRELFAFRCHRGLWQFKRMPLGYRNGPAVFQRVMQGILAPYLWIFALVYIDDIVIFSKTFEEHMIHIEKVLNAVAKSGITLSPTKCHFAYQSLSLLGQKVSRLGMSTDKEKVKAIIDLDEPRNVHELHTFLGMMVYFSAYIPFYAWIVNPLFKLLKKETTWNWTDLEQEAFELSKLALTQAPVRAYAIPGLGYRLYTDACDSSLAAILQQIQPIRVRDLKGTKSYDKLRKAFDNGERVPKLVLPIPIRDPGTEELINPTYYSEWDPNDFEETVVYAERVIAYWSRTLKSAERNYSPTEREALALKEGLIKYQPYIEGEAVVAITDHAALTWSKTFQNVNRRLLTWGTVFAAYPNVRIVHRAGRVHSNVDPVSRLRRRVPIQNGPDHDNLESISLIGKEDSLTDFYSTISKTFESRVLHLTAEALWREEHPNNLFITNVLLPDPENKSDLHNSLSLPYHTSSALNITVSISTDELNLWKEAYLQDPQTSLILSDLRSEEHPDNPRHPKYHLHENGLLYFEDWEGNLRLYVPKSLRVDLMKEDHENPNEGCHSGYHKAYNRLASVYFWPRMSREIKKFITTCDICQRAKIKKHAPYGLLKSIPIPSRPFEVITMDFIPELPKTAKGYDNVLVIVDKLTKFGIFIPTDITLSTPDAAKLVFENVFSKFGIPRQIIADRDSKWTSDFWKEICEQLKIKRALTTAYHPQADGQTEILNQVLETAFRCYVRPERNDWDEYLTPFSMAYNNTPHSSTGYSPSFLLMGYTPRSAYPIRDVHDLEEVDRSGANLEEPDPATRSPPQVFHLDAADMITEFNALRVRAKDSLSLAQVFQQRGYNRGRLNLEFEVGDKVLIKQSSSGLLRGEQGLGKKLFMKYDGPFEIQEKYSPITYRLRLPSSYLMHPVINIAHLEPYKTSPEEFGDRLKRSAKREAKATEEFEIDHIVDQRKRKVGKRMTTQYKVRYTGYGSEEDQWVPETWLRNAPEYLRDWKTLSKKQSERVNYLTRSLLYLILLIAIHFLSQSLSSSHRTQSQSLAIVESRIAHERVFIQTPTLCFTTSLVFILDYPVYPAIFQLSVQFSSTFFVFFFCNMSSNVNVNYISSLSILRESSRKIINDHKEDPYLLARVLFPSITAGLDRIVEPRDLLHLYSHTTDNLYKLPEEVADPIYDANISIVRLVQAIANGKEDLFVPVGHFYEYEDTLHWPKVNNYWIPDFKLPNPNLCSKYNNNLTLPDAANDIIRYVDQYQRNGKILMMLLLDMIIGTYEEDDQRTLTVIQPGAHGVYVNAALSMIPTPKNCSIFSPYSKGESSLFIEWEGEFYYSTIFFVEIFLTRAILRTRRKLE